MTAEAQCSVGCEGLKAEFEGKGVLGLESEGDLKGLGDHDGIALRKAKENDEDSFVTVNRDSDDPAEGVLDLEEKLDPASDMVTGSAEKAVVAGDQEVSDGMGENGELCLENGHDHDEGVVSIMNSESKAACNGIKQQLETDIDAREEEEDEKLCEEKGVNGELCEEDGNKESHVNNEENGECCEENGEYEEEVRESGFENGQGHLEESASAVVEEEKQEGDTVVMGIDHREELESDAEESEPMTAVGETIQQAERQSDVEVEEDQEPETVAMETDHPEELEPAVEENQELEVLVAETSQFESAIELVEEHEAVTLFTDTEILRELESAIEVDEKQDPGAAVAMTNDLAEPASAVQVEEKQQPYSEVTKVDSQEEPKSVAVEGNAETDIVVPEANGHEESETVEIEEKQEAQEAVAQSDERMELESVKIEEKQQPLGVRETDDQEELESVVHVEGKQEIEVVVMETDDHEELKSVLVVEANQQPRLLVKEIDGQAELKSDDEVELTQEPETVVAEAGVMKVEEKQEPENVLVETEVLEGDEKRERLPVIAETMAFEPLPIENEVAWTSKGADDVPSDSSDQLQMLPEVKGETVLESDGKGSSKSGESSSICFANGMKSTSELSGDSLDNGVMPADHVDMWSESEARFGPLESLNFPRSCHADDKAMVSGSVCPVDDKSYRTDQTVPSEPKVGIPVEFAEPSPSDYVNGMDSKSELVIASIRSEIEIENDLVERGASNNEEFSIGNSNKDAYLDEMKIDYVVNDAESMTGSGERDQSTSKDDDKEPTSKEVGGSNGIQTPPEELSGLALDGEKSEIHAIKRKKVFIIRVPKFCVNELKTKEKNAKDLSDEKTQSRDSVRVEIQKQKATVSERLEKLKAARQKERDARAAADAKRQEVDSVQSMIIKIKNASSVDEIDEKIRKLEHMLQHETIPSLAQEKQYIREIKELRQRRQQLSSNMGPPEVIQEAYQKDIVEEQLKTLKKQYNPLKNDVYRADADVKTALKEYSEDSQILKGLQEQFRVADGLRQDAYGHYQNLAKDSHEKTKPFYTYRDDRNAAENYVYSGDRETLQSHCNRQVERIMELWNNDEEFRKEYIKSNVNSTLRRLGTLDGRSLGPGEEPPVLSSSFANQRSTNIRVPSSGNRTPAPVLNLEVKEESSPALTKPKRVEPTTIQPAKSKSSIAASRGTVKPTVPSSEEVIKEAEEEIKVTNAEEELERKAEELARKEEELARKEKADLELKEQLRLEQRAKAKEAEERKRRQAEKARAKAEYKAQKEAELKEKKKAKKEKKNVGSANRTNGGDEGDSATVVDAGATETSTKEPEAAITRASRRSSRPAAAVKQYNKIQPLPLPLRNRGKRKMQTWMWALLATLLVVSLFIACNYFSFGF